MNYLQLCQRTRRESGVSSGDASPASVTGQTGRDLKIVEWVATAWNDIQELHDNWAWMREDYLGTISADTPNYSATSFGITTRFQNWRKDEQSVTIYEDALGVSDESILTFMPWLEYRRKYVIGSQTTNRPLYYSISPDQEMWFGPIPNDTFKVRGEYQKSPQILANNTDIPELPGGDAMHMVIVWNALVLMGEFDEGLMTIQSATRRRSDLLRKIERLHLPTFGWGGPLA